MAHAPRSLRACVRQQRRIFRACERRCERPGGGARRHSGAAEGVDGIDIHCSRGGHDRRGWVRDGRLLFLEGHCSCWSRPWPVEGHDAVPGCVLLGDQRHPLRGRFCQRHRGPGQRLVLGVHFCRLCHARLARDVLHHRCARAGVHLAEIRSFSCLVLHRGQAHSLPCLPHSTGHRLHGLGLRYRPFDGCLRCAGPVERSGAAVVFEGVVESKYTDAVPNDQATHELGMMLYL
mmetsp:Transcript_47825/g.94709  ORF Transcript_47825/g.94709 Transcript_47825/m.94709 type:complete len:233 (+) Transcript_47825:288-986(+)